MSVRRLAALAAGGALALGAGACGGEDDEASGGGSQSSPPEAAPGGPGRALDEGQREALQGFADCLRAQGVEPRGGGGRPSFDFGDPDVQQAFQACRDRLPEGAGPGPGGDFGPPPGGSSQ